MKKTIYVFICIFGVISFFSYYFLNESIQENNRSLELRSTNNSSITIDYKNKSEITTLIEFAKEKKLNIVRVVPSGESLKYYHYFSFVKPEFSLQGNCDDLINSQKITAEKGSECYIDDMPGKVKTEYIPVEEINKRQDYDYSGVYILTDKNGLNKFKEDLDKKNIGSTTDTKIDASLDISLVLTIITTKIFVFIVIMLQYIFFNFYKSRSKAIYLLNSSNLKRYNNFCGKYFNFYLLINILLIYGLKFVSPNEVYNKTSNVIFIELVLGILFINLIYFISDIIIKKEINSTIKGGQKGKKVANLIKLFSFLLVSVTVLISSFMFINLRENDLERQKILSIQESSQYGKIIENENIIPPGQNFIGKKEIFKAKDKFNQKGSFYLRTEQISTNNYIKEKFCPNASNTKECNVVCPPGIPEEECNVPDFIEVDMNYLKEYMPGLLEEKNILNFGRKFTIIYPSKTKEELVAKVEKRYKKDFNYKGFLGPEGRNINVETPLVERISYEKNHKAFSFMKENDFYIDNPIIVLKSEELFKELSGDLYDFYIKKYDENSKDLTNTYWEEKLVDASVFSEEGAFNRIQGNLDIFNERIEVINQINYFLTIQIFFWTALAIFLIYQYIKIETSANKKKRMIQKINGYKWKDINSKYIKDSLLILIISNIVTVFYLYINRQNINSNMLEVFLVCFLITILYASAYFIASFITIKISDGKNTTEVLKGGGV